MWNAFQGTPLPCAIPEAERWISTLTAGRMHGRDIVVIGSDDGACRLFCLENQHTVVKLHLVARPNAVAFTDGGLLSVATTMSVVTIQVDPWRC
jgi:hypothetical protein